MIKSITQPKEYWQAFKHEAERQGMNLSEWIGKTCADSVEKNGIKLPERMKPGRPKNGVIPASKKDGRGR